MSLVKNAYYAAGAAYAQVASRVEPGTSIYDAEWDVCIVLDSARADMMARAVPQHLRRYEFSRRWSLGSVTTEWLASTFRSSRADAIADTTLVTAHPHTATVFDKREWLTTPAKSPVQYPDPPAVHPQSFEHVYRLYEHATGDHDVVLPDTMATATFSAYDRHGGRIVAHWMQPHEPFIGPGAPMVGGAALDGNVWEGLQAGTIDAEECWKSYRANLNYALRHVAAVADSIDARILVTADHGNLWDVAGQYGHPFGNPHPEVRRVPWVIVDGQTNGSVELDPTVLDASASASTEDQLKALGYQ